MRKDVLLCSTYFYLSIPYILFFYYWFNPVSSILFIGLLLFALGDVWYKDKTDISFNINCTTIFLLLLAILMAYYAGAGGYSKQESDYYKHNLLFNDLINHQWPVIYSNQALGDPFLCYYLAYYLPVSWIAKITGITHAENIAFLWTCTGIFLGLCWVYRITRNRLIVIAIWLIGGTDYLYNLIKWAGIRLDLPVNFSRSEEGMYGVVLDRYLLKYSNNSLVTIHKPDFYLDLDLEFLWRQLIFVPQHCLPVLLGIGIFWKRLQEKSSYDVLMIIALVSLWSPFTAIGFIPFAGWLIYTSEAKHIISIPNILGGFIGLGIACFMLAHFPHPFKGLLFSRLNTLIDFVNYAWYILMEFGMMAIAYFLLKERKRSDTIPAGLMIASLVVVSFIYMGYYNDWIMRVSQPVLVSFHLVVLQQLVYLFYRRNLFSNKRAWVLLFIGMVSMICPVREILYLAYNRLLIEQPERTSSIAEPHQYGADLSRYAGAGPGEKEWSVETQYLGSKDSFFYKYLMNK